MTAADGTKPLDATIIEQVIVDGVHTLARSVEPLATLVANRQPPIIVPKQGKIARAANPAHDEWVSVGEGLERDWEFAGLEESVVGGRARRWALGSRSC